MSADGEATFTVRSRRMVLSDGIVAAAIHVSGGHIISISDHGDAVGEVIDVGDHVVLPGLVDPHVHVNEPGRTEWEGFESATRAAAAGGTTTIVDMPLNCIPPTTTAPALQTKLAAARGKCAVDVAFWGGVVPDNQGDLDALLGAGVVGCKAFLVDSGIPEFPAVDADRLRTAMPLLREAGVPLLVHAELDDPMEGARRRFESADAEIRRVYRAYANSRPPEAEVAAIALLIGLVRETGAAVHIVHLAAAAALPLIADAQRDGLPVTAETCPHYLTLAAEEIPHGATEFKCAPPIRDRHNAERLWEGLADGTVGMIASDHSPSPPDLKGRGEGDFAAAWGGIASLQLRLPLIWTAARDRGHDLSAVARWLSGEPARLAGLDRKGAIELGTDADLVVFDPDHAWRVDPTTLEHRHALTPYSGREVTGRVVATYLRGRRIYDGASFDDTGSGRLFLRDGTEAA